METIKVNMSPNPLDVQTIHASQNDGEARQWEFELHNNGELIDTSKITEQMFFKAYKGGTEQLLPENTSTPTTSPFKGDIRYPQGLLTDQEFTYRQSPTESDGLAKITDVKGNTLVWNQLVQNGNFADTSGTGFGVVQGTVSYANNTATVVPNVSTDRPVFRINQTISVANHRMLLMAETSEQIITFVAYTSGWTEIVATNDIIRVGNRNFIFFTPSLATSIHYLRFNSGLTSITIKNVMCFDLTQMGLDITDPSEFTSLFPLSYYAYNQGSLLSFNGNGIKTVGKNMIDSVEQGAYSSTGSDASSITRLRTKFVSVQPNTTYSAKISGTVTFDILVTEFSNNDLQEQYIYQSAWNQNQITFTTLSNCYYVRLMFKDHNNASATLTPSMATEVQLEKSSAPTSYEPYTSSTLSLPISTYFPNGMNGHGDTYDELTSAVATKRFEKDSLGDLNWTRRTTNIFSANLPSEFDASKDISCFMSNRLPTVFVSGYTLAEDGYISIYKTTTVTSSTSIYLNMASQSIDTVADLQTWLSNNPTELVYPLATPTESSFTIASLVTENAEIPLSNEDGVLIGKCTEQLSAEPGFIDAKIKLADADGTCYSNKLQLHVERSPQ